MKWKLSVLAGALSLVIAAQSLDKIPSWAYGTVPPQPPAVQKAPDLAPHHIAGSPLEFTIAQIRNPFGPADWFPEDHPAMPPIVANGSQPNAMACSFCHYPNGKGRPENAGVAGLPVEYFIQTMNDFKNGLRNSADPRKKNTANMIRFAKNIRPL